MIDSTTITIKIKNISVRILSVYKSLNLPITNNDLDFLTSHGGLFVIAGDLNAKHSTLHCRFTNIAGRIIHRHMVASNTYTVCAPDSPTHFPFNAHHRPEILDISLINLRHHEHTITNHNELSTDHNPISISINNSPITSRHPFAKKRI